MEDLQNVLISLITIVVGILGMPIVDFIKKQLKVEGRVALFITLCVSVVLGVLVVAGKGLLANIEPTPESITNTFTLIFSSATIFYKLLSADKKKEE